MNQSLVSVLMPAYNAERFIDMSIRSILSQTYTAFELIIVNDGSTDATSAVVGRHTDPRIRYFDRPHLGHAKQRNFAFNEARGEYIAVMDADDLSDKDRLSEQLRFLEEHPDIDCVGSNGIFIDENDREIKRQPMPRTHEDIEFMMPILCSVFHSAAFFRRRTIDTIGGYVEKDIPTLDQDLFLRMLRAGFRFHNIQMPLYFYRQWNGSMTQNTVSIGQRISFDTGLAYINETSTNATSRDRFIYYKRLGLLEYYKGSMKKARSYFAHAALMSPKHIYSLLRFWLPAMAGDNVMTTLRQAGLTQRLNILLNRHAGWDPQTIRKHGGNKD